MNVNIVAKILIGARCYSYNLPVLRRSGVVSRSFVRVMCTAFCSLEIGDQRSSGKEKWGSTAWYVGISTQHCYIHWAEHWSEQTSRLYCTIWIYWEESYCTLNSNPFLLLDEEYHRPLLQWRYWEVLEEEAKKWIDSCIASNHNIQTRNESNCFDFVKE